MTIQGLLLNKSSESFELHMTQECIQMTQEKHKRSLPVPIVVRKPFKYRVIDTHAPYIVL